MSFVNRRKEKLGPFAGVDRLSSHGEIFSLQ